MNTYAIIADLKSHCQQQWEQWDRNAENAKGRESDVYHRSAARRGVYSEILELIDQLETIYE